MKQSKTSKYAYVAGIIDGEGCISVHKARNDRPNDNRGYDMYVCVNQNDGRILDYCLGVFGGKIYSGLNYGKPLYKWVVCNENALFMLKRILPFLKRKKIEAQIAMEFEIFKRKTLSEWRKSFGIKGIQNAQVKQMPEWMMTKREEYYLKLRELKLEKFPPRAGAETNYNHPSIEMESDSPILQEAIV